MRPSDALLVLPVYDAGGTADRSVNSADLVKLLEGEALTVEDFDEAIEWCRARKDRFGAFVTCGARDPDLPSFALRLSQAVE
jgi:UDP-N-acetylmuramate-alanine ligase